jgi:hypothetical protein
MGNRGVELSEDGVMLRLVRLVELQLCAMSGRQSEQTRWMSVDVGKHVKCLCALMG